MPLLDPRLRSRPARYVGQCAFATLSVFLILLSLDMVLHADIVATLGATTFIVFAMPHLHSAQPRPLIGGYVIGTVCGLACFYAATQLAILWPAETRTIFIAMGALAVGIAIFGMVALQAEHPPAAGMALMLVIRSWTWEMVLLVLSAVLMLSLVRWLLRHRLINLI